RIGHGSRTSARRCSGSLRAASSNAWCRCCAWKETDMAHLWRGVLREYADRLGVTDASTVVTLGEGGTPLLPAPALSRRTGTEVWVKFEGMNPTGSFKDRGMTVALSRAVEHGAQAVI